MKKKVLRENKKGKNELSRAERHFGEKEKINRDEFMLLEKRVAILEKSRR